MNETPKGLRKHIALAGRRNAGKSSLLNALCGQTASIVSDIPGTTTDPVEKTMEISGIGPVVWLDTAGLDDAGLVGEKRVQRSRDIIRRSDCVLIVATDGSWGNEEKILAAELEKSRIPYIVIRNKFDLGVARPLEDWRKKNGISKNVPALDISAKNHEGLAELIKTLANILDSDAADAPLLNDLLPENGLAALVTPIDTGAPKGRLILPQMQAIRDCLDGGKICMVLTEREFEAGLGKLAAKPDLVVCDSQVIKQIAAKTPPDVPLTTFSILMARFKGNLNDLAAGAGAIANLRPGDDVLIQEACSHHPQEEDIGRVKIPAMLRRIAGGDLNIKFSAGKEFGAYDASCRLVVHCGACVITRKQMLARQEYAKNSGCPMTNYGMAISLVQGVLPRVLALFPEALRAFEKARNGKHPGQ